MTVIRWLPLDGVVNARDVGDIPLRDGGKVIPGRLFRSDNLSDLTDQDVEALIDELGVTSVVDLRTDAELRNEGRGRLADHAGVRVYHLSLLPDQTPVRPGDGTAEILPWQDRSSERRGSSAGATYLRYLTERPDSMLAALRVIAQPDGATLVHCAAGKDRTGMVIAFALLAVGADRDAVIADYVATADRIERVLARLMTSPGYARDLDLTNVDRHRPRAETLSAVLDEVEARYGGVDGWLRAHGWTDADAGALRDRLCHA